MKKIIVVASTFPKDGKDPVPAFVRDQVIAIKKISPEVSFTILAPHDRRSKTKDYSRHKYYDEYRFHYFWPYSLEKLAGRGIMPALKSNPLYYMLIPFLFFGEFIALLRLTNKLSPNLIYAHWFTPQAINARWVGQLTNTPFVFTTHAADVEVWKKIPLIGKVIVSNNVKKAGSFTAVSKRTMQKLKGFFSDREWEDLKKRSSIIPMGIDLQNIHKRSGKRTNVILFLGRLAEKKGVQYLLPAYSKVKDKLPDSKLIIAGDGPYLNILKNQANQLGISDRVEFIGYVTGSKKRETIINSDIFVVPSIITDNGDAEGMPVSLMEGLAFGKICIATNESGADDIITHQKSGYLIPQKDTDKLAGAIVAAYSLNEKGFESMRAEAIKTSQQFSWTSVAKKHLNFLFNI